MSLFSGLSASLAYFHSTPPYLSRRGTSKTEILSCFSAQLFQRFPSMLSIKANYKPYKGCLFFTSLPLLSFSLLSPSLVVELVRQYSQLRDFALAMPFDSSKVPRSASSVPSSLNLKITFSGHLVDQLVECLTLDFGPRP